MSAYAMAYEIAEEVRVSECWDVELCSKLCCIAGLDEEICACEDTYSLLDLTKRAAKVLGVDIV